MEIKLKSVIIKDKDYRTIDLSRFAKPLTIDPQSLEKGILKYTTPYAKRVEVSCIENRDLVTLTMRSVLARFNKEHIEARIGLGMLTRELENALLGTACGETRELMVKGTAVSVTVEKIIREIVPELTDRLVAEMKISGIDTAEQLRSRVLKELCEDALETECDDAYAFLGAELENASEFQLSEEECRLAYADFKVMTAGNPNMTDEMARLCSGNMLKSAVRGQNMLEERGELLTNEDYEIYLVAEAERRRCTADTVRQEVSPVVYIIWEYSSWYMDTMEDYVAEELTKLSLKKEIEK